MKPLRTVAIVGTGGIAAAHARALAAQSGITLVAAIDLDETRARAFAAEWGIASTHASLTDAARDTQIDLVAICTPPSSHAPLAIEALRLGLHVVIEKPPALSLSALDAVARAEAESAGTVSCIFQHRFGGAAQHLRSLVAAGDLGAPLVGTCNTLWYRNQDYFDVPWRGKWEVEGGGPTLGHGIHQFDLLLHLLGPWQELTAFASKLARRTHTEDVSAALVRFETGALVTVINSVISPRETSDIRLDFEHATVELSHLYGYNDANWTFTPAPGHEYLAARWAERETGRASGHAAQYADLLACLARGEAPQVGLHEARATLEFAAATYAAALTGRPVRPLDLNANSPFYTRMDGHLDPWAAATAGAGA
ncbi:Gfo/Idh/MocA family oxidoreductase [Micrococcales bacterium 31B]|nr:Gfo/Idh/MocA family oxidoreductase [Micrococcales bacterium 31B]